MAQGKFWPILTKKELHESLSAQEVLINCYGSLLVREHYAAFDLLPFDHKNASRITM